MLGPGKVKFVHQLNSDGSAYAEDVTLTSDVPGRLAYWAEQDGKVGVISYSFSASSPQPEGLLFPEESTE